MYKYGLIQIESDLQFSFSNHNLYFIAEYNKQLKGIDFNNNNLNYDSVKHISRALRHNTTLKYLNVN